MFIIHLQARQPKMKDDTKPTARGRASIEPITFSPFVIFSTSSRASPKMGGITIRNENCASDSFLLPNSRPVAMVLPERDTPGSTATACASPMMKASFIEICSF